MNEFGELPQEPELADDRLQIRRAHLMQQISERQPNSLGDLPELDARRNEAESRRRLRSQLRRRLVAVTAAAASVALIFGVVQMTSPDKKSGAPSTDVAQSADPNDPKFILASVQKAVTMKTVIVHTSQTDTSVDGKTIRYTEVWIDPVSPNNFRVRTYEANSKTKPTLDSGRFLKDGVVQSRQVDFQTGVAVNGETKPEAKVRGEPNPGYGSLVNDTVLGYETIDGTDTIHLSDPEPGFNRELWVDAETKLPIRMTSHGTFGTTEILYDWIPRNDGTVESIMFPPLPEGIKVATTTADALPTSPPAGAVVNTTSQLQNSGYCGKFVAINPATQTIYWEAQVRYDTGTDWARRVPVSGLYAMKVADNAEILLEDRTPASITDLLTREREHPWAGVHNVYVKDNQIVRESNIMLTATCLKGGS